MQLGAYPGVEHVGTQPSAHISEPPVQLQPLELLEEDEELEDEEVEVPQTID